MLTLKATKNNFESYINNPKNYHITSLTKKLKKQINGHPINLPFILTKDLFPIESSLKSTTNFYKIALERDLALTQNLVTELTRLKQKNAIFVTGSFHTSGVTEFFRQNQTSYLIVSPLIKKEFNDKLYFKLMNDQKKYLGDSLYTTASNLSRVLTLDKTIFDESFREDLNTIALAFGKKKITKENMNDLIYKKGFPEFERLEMAKDTVKNILTKHQNSGETEWIDFLKTTLVKLNNEWHLRNDADLDAKYSTNNDVRDLVNRASDNITQISEIHAETARNETSPSLGIAALTTHKPSFTPNNTDREEWTVNRMDELFKQFFSNETSRFSSSLDAKKYLQTMLEILEIPNPPSDNTQDTFKQTCQVILNNATNFDTINSKVLKQYPNPVNRITVVQGFYVNIKKEQTEEVLLQSLRTLLGYAQKKINESAIKNCRDIKDPKDFKTLLEKLFDNKIDEQIDSLRTLTLEENDRKVFIDNLEHLRKNIEIIIAFPSSSNNNGKQVNDFLIDTENLKLYFNPKILPYFDLTKDMNYFGKFFDGQYFELNVLLSILEGALGHEIVHFTFQTLDEKVANTGLGSRYGFFNYASHAFVTALSVNNITSNLNAIDDLLKQEITNVLTKIIKPNKSKQQRLRAQILPQVYINNSDLIMGIGQNFVTDIVNNWTSRDFNKALDQNPLPNITRTGFIDKIVPYKDLKSSSI